MQPDPWVNIVGAEKLTGEEDKRPEFDKNDQWK